MHLTSIQRIQVWSLAPLSGLRIWHCHELWCRLAAVALIRFLAWELPVALKTHTHTKSNPPPLKNWVGLKKKCQGVLNSAQWVKDLTAAVAAEMWVPSPAQCSGLRIRCCRSCGIDHSYGLGTSICHGCGQKENQLLFFIKLFFWDTSQNSHRFRNLI